MAQDNNANNIFTQYEDYTSRIEKLRNEAKPMLTPTLDNIKKEINDYNKLAEVVGLLTRLSLTENHVNNNASESNAVSADNATNTNDGNATIVSTDDNSTNAVNAGDDASNENHHASNDDSSNVNDTTASKSASSSGRFYEDDAKVEEVERVDGSKVKVERYRKPVARKTTIPAPIDVENIDFTGSNDDTNVIVSSNDVNNNSESSASDDSDDNELDFDDLLDDAITDNDTDTNSKKTTSSKKSSSTTTKKSTASHKSSSKTVKNHNEDESVPSESVNENTDDSDGDEPDPFAFIS